MRDFRHSPRHRRQHMLTTSIVALAWLTLTACGGGDGGGSAAPAASATGTNVVTGIMPVSSTTATRTMPAPTRFFAQMIGWFTGADSAYAFGTKGRVRVVGTTIEANPVGGGRFQLLRVPDGPVTLDVSSPDGERGTLTLPLLPGGGAIIDLGHLTVRKGRAVAEYEPSHEHALYPGMIRARGDVSGLPAVGYTAAPAGTACDAQTFVVAGVTFCFDEHTQFDPPLRTEAFTNTDPAGKSAVVFAQPFGDAHSKIFRARRIQRNSGSSSANDNTVQAIAPITGFSADSITLFGTPLKPDDGNPATSEVNAHAITFDTSKARFTPRSLEGHLSRGLVVEIETPKKAKNQPAVTIDGTTGQQVAEADRVRLIRAGDAACIRGEFVYATGAVFSPDAQTKTFGLTTSNGPLFVQVIDTLTQFDEPLTGFGSLTAGTFVEVFAQPPLTVGGPLRAVRIDDAPGPGQVEVHGTISSLDASAKTFVVGGMKFCYDQGCDPDVVTQFFGFNTDKTDFADGQFVEVIGSAPATAGGTASALYIEKRDTPYPSSCSDGKGTDDDRP